MLDSRPCNSKSFISSRSTSRRLCALPLSPPVKPYSRSVRPGPAGARNLHVSRILVCGGCAVWDSWVRGPLEISPNRWLIPKHTKSVSSNSVSSLAPAGDFVSHHKLHRASTASRRRPSCLGSGALSQPSFHWASQSTGTLYPSTVAHHPVRDDRGRCGKNSSGKIGRSISRLVSHASLSSAP